MKIDVIIEDKFLEKFRNNRDKTEDEENWHNLRTFLIKSNHINLFDCDGCILEPHSITRVYFDPNNKPPSSKEQDFKNYNKLSNPFSILFLSKDKSYIDKKQEKYGYKIIGYDWEASWKAIKVEKSKMIDNDFSWDFFLEIKQPSNLILLVDQYILSKKIEEIEINLLELIKKILYHKNVDEIRLVIILSTGINNQKATHEELIKKIEKLKNRYNIRFTILAFNNGIDAFSKVFHDRCIYTNYFQYISGNSFAYFNQQEKIFPNLNTQIDIHSFINPDRFEASMKRMEKYLKYIKKYEQNDNLSILGEHKLLQELFDIFDIEDF